MEPLESWHPHSNGHIVLPPKPKNSFVWSFHRIHELLNHFLKMFITFLAPKECANVSPHGLQHSLGVGVCFKACANQCFWINGDLNSQSVKQLPEGA